MLIKKLLFPAAIALAAALSTGCQTTAMEGEAMEEAVDPLAEVREIANEALRTANTASHDAATAKDMALSAQEAANAAQACCDANSRRMSRMFSGSMSSK